MLLKFILGLALIGACQGVYEDCDFYEEMVPDKTYFVVSPGYPNFYPEGRSCRWYLASPPNTRINFTCEDIYIPVSQDCQFSALGISRKGNIDLSDVQYFCGTNAVRVVSESNKLNAVLLTMAQSSKGIFVCHSEVITNLSSQPIPTPTSSQVPPTPPKPAVLPETIPLLSSSASKESIIFPRPTAGPDCICGLVKPSRIVGGVEVEVNQYPMMAGLVHRTNRELFCGATIISPRFVLTAAHCVLKNKPENLAVLVGDHDISIGNETDYAKLYKADNYYIHPEYHSINQQNDVALVKTAEKMSFNLNVGAVCLPFSNNESTFVGENVYALGWGTVGFGESSSTRLLHARLDVATAHQCKSTYGDLITPHQMCTYRQGKDACQGDSGGPLLWKDPISKVLKLVGIVSYGIQCATTSPSVNTRVTSYLDWVRDITNEAYCIK